MIDTTEALVSTDWLLDHLEQPDLRVVDASWYMPDQKRNPRAEYAAEHIPGAVFMDLAELTVGLGLFCFISLLLIQVWLEVVMSPHQIWSALSGEDLHAGD